MNRNNKEPDIKCLLQFIQERAELLKTSFAKEHARTKAEKKPNSNKATSDEKRKPHQKTLATSNPQPSTQTQPTNKTTNSSPQEQSKPSCAICDQEHYVHQCEKFTKMSIDDRQKAVQENNLCFNCLKKGHSSRRCRNRYTCKECRRSHHTLLHKEREEKTEEKPPDKPNVTAMCAMNNHSVLFPIVAVVVRANGRQIKTRAVLDQCSTLSLCTEALLNKLHVKGTPTPLEVDTVNGLRVNNNSVTANLQICSIDQEAKFTLTALRSVPRLPVSISSMASTQTLNSYTHLNDISLPTCNSNDVDLLIGSNCPDIFMITDHRYGKPGEPYAQQFPLGWTVIGPVNSNSTSRHTVNLTSEVTNADLSNMFVKLRQYDFPDALSSSKQELSVEGRKKITNPNLREEIIGIQSRSFINM